MEHTDDTPYEDPVGDVEVPVDSTDMYYEEHYETHMDTGEYEGSSLDPPVEHPPTADPVQDPTAYGDVGEYTDHSHINVAPPVDSEAGAWGDAPVEQTWSTEEPFDARVHRLTPSPPPARPPAAADEPPPSTPEFFASTYGVAQPLPTADPLPPMPPTDFTPPVATPPPLGSTPMFSPPRDTSFTLHSTPSAAESDLAVRTKTWISQKGYGWLLECDDDDEVQRPLLEELDINPQDILFKIKCVMWPFSLKQRDHRLAEPDFWGPFFIVLGYALLLVWGQFKAVSWVFTLWICGSFVVYFVARVFDGGEGGYPAVLAVTGYSLIPLVVLCIVLLFFRNQAVVSLVLKMVHTVWCTYAAKTLLVSERLQPRQWLVTYPILLLYVYFVSLHSGV